MEYLKLGGTDILVSRIGLGCEQLGGTDWGRIEGADTIAAVSRAVELGVNLFDTADVYGLGKSEEQLAKALGSKRHDVVIVSKVGVKWENSPNGGRARIYSDSSPEHIQKSIEDSLRRLRIDCLPIYMIHRPDLNIPTKKTLDAMMTLKHQGKIKYIGLSNHSRTLIQEAMKFADISVAEFEFSLMRRDAEEDLLPFLERHRIGAIVYGVLAQGLLTLKYDSSTQFDQDDRRYRLPQFQHEGWVLNKDLLDRLSTVARSKNISGSQVAIRWALNSIGITSVLVGVKNAHQVDHNVASFSAPLSMDDYRFLTAQSY